MEVAVVAADTRGFGVGPHVLDARQDRVSAALWAVTAVAVRKRYLPQMRELRAPSFFLPPVWVLPRESPLGRK